MPLRVAVEGCGHGTLHAIYASVTKASEAKGWSGVDVLIICGDFQAVRNSYDLNAMAVPNKFKAIGDFHEYYSGARKAPYLTIFIGGNHEASNYLSELYYGGWAAPNIYYLGASNVIRLGGLRIAGLSGIWKGYNFRKPHFEVVPYSKDDLRSVYHVRELDTRKLLCVRSQVDVALSHDWPQGVEWKGDWKKLFRDKSFFEADARSGNLGSVAAKMVLDRLRPFHWFSAHLHCKYAAVVRHEQSNATATIPVGNGEVAVNVANQDEIALDLDEDDIPITTAQTQVRTQHSKQDQSQAASTVPLSLKEQLPASFRQSKLTDPVEKALVPTAIRNGLTRFLALDKCLPKRHFLQLVEIPMEETSDTSGERPYLTYDNEWLAITRVFAPEVMSSTSNAVATKDKGYEHYTTRIDEELEWVEKRIVQKGLVKIPENFHPTAPIYDSSISIHTRDQPSTYTNPQTEIYCKMLEIGVPFTM